MANLIKSFQNTIKNWWIPVIVGILFIVLGVYIFMNPETAYQGLTMIFSVSFIVIGIAEIYFAFSNKDNIANWGWILFFGLVTLAIGVLLVNNQDVAQNTFPFFVGFLLLFRSIAGISFALDLKDYGILDWGTVMVISVLALIFSFVLLWNLKFTEATIVIWNGLALLFIGVLSIYIGIQFRKIQTLPERISSELKQRWEDLQKQVKEAGDQLEQEINNAVNSASSGNTES